MKLFNRTFAAVITCALSMPAIASPIPNYAVGAWTYDDTTNIDKKGKHIKLNGEQAANVIDYNHKAALANNTISQLFVYSSDLEMIHDSDEWTPCTAQSNTTATCTPYVFFDLSQVPDKNKPKITYYGKANVAAYKQQLNKHVKHYVAVIDGRADNLGVDQGYAGVFNSMTPELADKSADVIAKQVCADDNVDGVQFDIEPFNVADDTGNKTTQYEFYHQIAKDFSNNNFNCKNSVHPDGRFFSVFTYANKVNQTLATLFNQYHNGYVIDALYDLQDPNAEYAGVVSTKPDLYKTFAAAEISSMINKAKNYHVKFQFGIPVAASVHEFEYYENVDPKTHLADDVKHYPAHRDGSTNHVAQDDYLKALQTVFTNLRVDLENNPDYIGIDLWNFSNFVPWEPAIDGQLVERWYYPAKISATATLQNLLAVAHKA